MSHAALLRLSSHRCHPIFTQAWRASVLRSRSFQTQANLRQQQQPIASQHSAYLAARNAAYKSRNRNLMYYTAAVLVLGIGVTYAAVPLYRLFCSATGFGGVPMTTGGGASHNAKYAADRLVAREDGGLSGPEAKKIRISFNADCSDHLPWKFTPSQPEVHVLPGETALAFYSARNRSTEDIIGIATYNVMPDKVAPYFAKVECFCFEEQKLLAGEEVDLPVFFFIDRDFVDDPSMKDVNDIVLSYTFFRAKRNKFGDLVPADNK